MAGDPGARGGFGRASNSWVKAGAGKAEAGGEIASRDRVDQVGFTGPRDSGTTGAISASAKWGTAGAETGAKGAAAKGDTRPATKGASAADLASNAAVKAVAAGGSTGTGAGRRAGSLVGRAMGKAIAVISRVSAEGVGGAATPAGVGAIPAIRRRGLRFGIGGALAAADSESSARAGAASRRFPGISGRGGRSDSIISSIAGLTRVPVRALEICANAGPTAATRQTVVAKPGRTNRHGVPLVLPKRAARSLMAPPSGKIR